MNQAQNADRETKDRLRLEFRRLYLKEYQRERRQSLTPVTLEFTEEEMRSIMLRSNGYGNGLATFLKDLVLGNIRKLNVNNREVLELKSTITTTVQILDVVKNDILDDVKRAMVEQQLEKLNRLTASSNDP